MQKWLPFLFLFTIHSAFAQQKKSDQEYFIEEQSTLNIKRPDCHCGIRIPLTFIGKGSAGRRFGRYDDKISKCGLKHLPRKVSYSPGGVEDLLETITQQSYDGFRAYFAVFPSKPLDGSVPDSGYALIPADQGGQLTLIFVPTSSDPVDPQRHPDDTAHCMIIRGDKKVIVNAKFASMWVRKGEDQVLSKFESGAQPTNPPFSEARSLWFTNSHVIHNRAYNGLLDIIRCRICTNSITRVDARFGAFWKHNLHGYGNKLTIVYTIVNEHKRDYYVSLSAEDTLTGLTDAATSGSDTGKPCPPPTNCNTSRGALLPAQP